MMTLHEAISEMRTDVSSEERVLEIAQQSLPTVEEVMTSKDAKHYIDSLTEDFPLLTILRPKQLALMAFAIGITVGMRMEKAEWVPPLYDK